jgi:uncharacterized protein involved in type VI secretion and phage assembly
MSESIIDILSQGRDREAQASKIYGMVIGIVTNNKDPDGLGRVKVKFPWLDDKVESWWARIIYPMAGKKMGFFWIPEIEDEVLVAFEHGDVRFPYILGSLYNGVDKPPSAGHAAKGRDANSDGKNDLRMIRSRSGHMLIFDDKDGEGMITLIDNTGNHKMEICVKDKKVIITNTDGDIELKAKKKVLIECETLETKSSDATSMTVGGAMDIKVEKDMSTTVKQASNLKTSSGGVKIESGTSLDAKASSAATLKGSSVDVTATGAVKCSGGTAEVSASGNTTIKGGQVMIN